MVNTKIRLAIINTIKIWGGGEYWFYKTSKEFIDRGYNVSIITSENSMFSSKLAEENISHTTLNISFFKYIKTFFRLKRWAKEIKPNIILVNCGKDLKLAFIIKLYSKSTKIIFRRGLDKKITNNIFHRILFSKVSFIISNSEATKNTMLKSFPWFDADKIFVVYNPINEKDYENGQADNIKSIYRIPKNARIIGIIGRLTKQKGHLVLFKAFQKIIQSYSNIYLLIVGKGELQQTLEEQTKELGINDYSVFTGHTEAVKPYYQACDFVVIPSFFEGFCYTAVESQLFERPVIVSNTSSLPEVVCDELHDYMFQTGNSEVLVQKILKFLDNKELLKHLGNCGKTFVEDKFSAKKNYDFLEEIFHRIV